MSRKKLDSGNLPRINTNFHEYFLVKNPGPEGQASILPQRGGVCGYVTNGMMQMLLTIAVIRDNSCQLVANYFLKG